MYCLPTVTSEQNASIYRTNHKKEQQRPLYSYIWPQKINLELSYITQLTQFRSVFVQIHVQKGEKMPIPGLELVFFPSEGQCTPTSSALPQVNVNVH